MKNTQYQFQAHNSFIYRLLTANCEFIIANWFDGLAEAAIKQYIVDRYNTGEMLTDLNIFQVDFESISAQIVAIDKDAIEYLVGKLA